MTAKRDYLVGVMISPLRNSFIAGGMRCEESVCTAWQHQLLDKDKLSAATEAGFQVVYPGRRSRGEGPDFRDAFVATRSGTLLNGDIEVDLRASAWKGHKHHLNRGYNGVIIHVVLENDVGDSTILENGTSVPILSLAGVITESWENLASRNFRASEKVHPCDGIDELIGHGDALQLLEKEGEHRFSRKVLEFQQALTDKNADQVLFEGVAEALGYSRNRSAFRALAEAMPFHILRGLTSGKDINRANLITQAILFGMAGLLPSTTAQGYLDNRLATDFGAELERIWTSYGGLAPCLESTDWHFSGIRPCNSPVRRVAGLAGLVTKLPFDIADHLISRFKQRVDSRALVELRKLFEVGAEGFWTDHKDLGSSALTEAPALVGQSRAADIVLNVVLPFIYAYGELTSDDMLMEKARMAFCLHPRLSDNWVTRHVSNQIFGSTVVPLRLKASHQQGMLSLYHRFCRGRLCSACPMAAAAA